MARHAAIARRHIPATGDLLVMHVQGELSFACPGEQMIELRDASQALLADYWMAAVEPLHNMGWQTLTLFAAILIAAALIITALLHYSWMFSKPALRGVTIGRIPHAYQDHLRLSAEDHLIFHHVKATPMAPAARDAREKDLTRYYVVTIVQAKPRRELVYREFRLQAPPTGMAKLPAGQIGLDAQALGTVRRGNSSDLDDETSSDIVGTYDVYIRPVRWFDVRHWLLHPNREIRIVVWVTLITTGLPVLLDLLFG